MVTVTHPRTATAESTSAARWLPALRALILAGLTLAAVYGLWRVFVGTSRGQTVDALAWEGSKIGAWRIGDQARELLQVVSVPAVAAVIVLVAVVALLRRQWMLAFEAAAVVAGANVTTQLLKYVVFTRKDLIDADATAGMDNSLPSGHTTVAASAAVAALLVVPPALRALTALLGAGTAIAFGYSTLVGQWHRPSDVVAGVLVAFAWGFLAVAIGRSRRAAFGSTRLLPEPESAPSNVMAWTLAGFGMVCLVGAAVALWLSLQESLEGATRLAQFVAYLGGATGLVGVTAGANAVLLRLLAR